MKRPILLDTGPLVAFLDRRDKYHAWAVRQWGGCEAPFLSCEAVLSEACFLVRQLPTGSRQVFELLDRGVIQVAFRLEDQLTPVGKLMEKYREVPVSLADACLVRMAEIHTNSAVLTLDSDFRLYRKHGRQDIPVITADEL